jgi:hypothetical protein
VYIPGRSQRGVVLVWLTVFFLLILGFAALCVDMAKLMATRTQLQNAADAAALAGASAIQLETGSLDTGLATQRAQATAAENRAFLLNSDPIQLLAGDVSFPTPNHVRVIVRRSPAAGGSMVTHFARVLGIPAIELSATATAYADTVSVTCEGLLPMAPVEPPNSGWFDPDCAKTYELKVGSGDGQQGNYELLDYPACTEGPCAGTNGGAAIRCLGEHGYGCCLDEGQEFALTEPGNKVGPFRQGMQARFDADTDQREGICYSQYQGNGKRLLHVPVVESFDVNGKKLVRIVRFSAFFIKYRPPGNATLQGQFVHDVTPGGGGQSGHGTLFAIRLVE